MLLLVAKSFKLIACLEATGASISFIRQAAQYKRNEQCDNNKTNNSHNVIPSSNNTHQHITMPIIRMTRLKRSSNNVMLGFGAQSVFAAAQCHSNALQRDSDKGSVRIRRER